MKKKLAALMLVVALVLTLGLAPVTFAAKPTPQLLAGLDIDTQIGPPNTVTYTTLAGTVNAWSFNPEQPGNWGGEYGGGAVTAFPGDPDPNGYITLSWTTTGFARHIELRVLDGIADDSFDVYVMNPGGDWALVYSYTDQTNIETWIVHHIYGFPAGKGKQDSLIYIKIVPTNVGWWGFNTWGQLAVDYVKVWNH